MGKAKIDKYEMADFLLENVEKHSKDIVRLTSTHFGISKQTVYRHIRELVQSGDLIAWGDTRNKKFKPKSTSEYLSFDVNEQLDEEEVWRHSIRPILPTLPHNIMDICHYGLGEMINNVIDHSGASKMDVIVEYNLSKVEFWIKDNGIGIFTKVQIDFNLIDKHHAILELAKGKLTSDPTRHTGEGIFFTSRMFDTFAILSEDMVFLGHDNDDWLFPDREKFFKGTSVHMSIERRSDRTMKEVFNRFTPGIESEEFGFAKTTVPLRLLQYEGESLVSRSQAKRLIARFDQFKEVVLDFKGIELIGQPFADEVFRVFQNAHPNTHLYQINTNEDIDRMIKHVKH